MFPFGANSKSIVGLDIGSHSIKAVELRRAGKGWSPYRMGIKLLPPNVVSGGKIKDNDAMAQLLRDLWSEARFSCKRVSVGVGGPSVIIKKIQLPLMTELDLEDQISLEAEEHIPFDIEEVYLDFQILDQAAETMDVMLTACKRELVDSRLAPLIAAGLNPVVCDLDLFGVVNAFNMFCQPRQKKVSAKKVVFKKGSEKKGGESDSTAVVEVALLVNTGATNLSLAIIANGIPTFTRDHAFGGGRLLQEIMQNQEISLEEAELLVRQGQDSQKRPWVPAARELVVTPFLEQLGGLIRQSVEFYQNSHPNQRVSEVFVSGGSALLAETATNLTTFLNLPVQIVNPLTALGGKGVPDTAKTIRAEMLPEFLVAMGLALRGGG